VTGSLKTWSIIDELHKIEVPTLILNGEHDEAQDSCVVPYFQHIQKAKWVVIEGASHMSHVEKRERSMRLVGEFLNY
jgi:pimeloyl-ACP methyl ester carboxylesterase